MAFTFTKMHTLGNDFIVLDHRQHMHTLSLATRRWLADRHRGVGCDQLLVLESCQQPTVLCRYRIFNTDGGEVEQCGNGARCVARYLFDHDQLTQSHIQLACAAGIVTVVRGDNEQLSVNMGQPEFAPKAIGLTVDTMQLHYQASISTSQRTFGAVSMGNPHAVFVVEELDQVDLEQVGRFLNAKSNKLFAQGVNVGFMQITAPNHINLAVYERGVGCTLGCGSGACAAVVLGQRWGQLAKSVQVTLPGGELQVSCDGADAPVWLQGDAHTVFEGTIPIKMNTI